MIYDGKKWNLQSREETIDDMIDTNEMVMSPILTTNKRRRSIKKNIVHIVSPHCNFLDGAFEHFLCSN